MKTPDNLNILVPIGILVLVFSMRGELELRGRKERSMGVKREREGEDR